jgi:uncharacterized membrane protein (UPF0127 family)
MALLWKSKNAFRDKTHKRATSIISAAFLILSLILPSTGQSAVQFEKRKLKLGSHTLTVEIADTPERTAHGLMFRKSLPEGTGMLFEFPDEQIRSFWMKNTFVPLSIGYFNSKKELIDIQDMIPAQSEMQNQFQTYVSKGPAQYALEVPKGWFFKNKIILGQKFSFP